MSNFSHENTPPGFLPCTRESGHDGPCALRPNPNNQDTLNDGNAERTTRVSEPDAAITVDRLNLTPQEAEELSVNVRLSDIGQPSDAVKLLPCPFCGGDAELIDNSSAASSAYEFDREHIAPKPFHVRCPSAKCGYAPFRSHAKKEKAIQQWNARLYPLPIQCTACHSTEGFAYTDDGQYCGDCHLALNSRKNGVSLETVLAFEAGQEAAVGEVERLREVQFNLDKAWTHLCYLWRENKSCPCGARWESPNTYPHVIGCPTADALEWEAALAKGAEGGR